jgi:hypothetical protein
MMTCDDISCYILPESFPNWLVVAKKNMLLGFDFLTHNQMVKNLTHSASDTSPIINFPVEAIKAIKAKQIISVGTSYVIVHQPQKFGQKMGWF